MTFLINGCSNFFVNNNTSSSNTKSPPATIKNPSVGLPNFCPIHQLTPMHTKNIAKNNKAATKNVISSEAAKLLPLSAIRITESR